MSQDPLALPRILNLLINLLPLWLILAAIFTGHRVRRKRERFLADEEAHFAEKISVLNSATPPANSRCAGLVSGCAAVANNYFMLFCSGWKHLFGGELKSFTRLGSDARRLATVRMLREAEALGADMVCNLRFETALIQTGTNRNGAGVELIAYGTAVITEK